MGSVTPGKGVEVMLIQGDLHGAVNAGDAQGSHTELSHRFTSPRGSHHVGWWLWHLLGIGWGLLPVAGWQDLPLVPPARDRLGLLLCHGANLFSFPPHKEASSGSQVGTQLPGLCSSG